MKVITTFIKFRGDAVQLRVANVARQTGANACGLYAIAYALCLLERQDPVNI